MWDFGVKLIFGTWRRVKAKNSLGAFPNSSLTHSHKYTHLSSGSESLHNPCYSFR